MVSDFGPSGLREEMVLERLIRHELHHLRLHWWWFLVLGLLLIISGTAAITFPFAASVGAVIFLAVLLMFCGVATIVGAFWAGNWSGILVQLLVGILYLVCGFVISEKPIEGAVSFTMLIAVMFIVLGCFRTVGSLLIRFPQWGWALLNGIVTLLAGIVIFKNLPQDALWVIGLLVGLELLFNGWTWVMLAFAVRSLPEGTTPAETKPASA